jgi:hypothetical protein
MTYEIEAKSNIAPKVPENTLDIMLSLPCIDRIPIAGPRLLPYRVMP